MAAGLLRVKTTRNDVAAGLLRVKTTRNGVAAELLRAKTTRNDVAAELLRVKTTRNVLESSWKARIFIGERYIYKIIFFSDRVVLAMNYDKTKRNCK